MSRAPNVVIIDTHPAEQALLRYSLSRRGIASTTVSPQAGFEVIAATAPDLLLIDVGHDGAGMRLCRGLRAAVPGAEVILLSDVAESALRLTVPDLGGAAAVLARPLQPARIDAVLAPFLARDAQPPVRKRVLVVDDDEDVLRVVEKVLVNAGCDVTCVSDSRSLVADVPGPSFELVLVDVVMPEVDGLEVCFLLRQRYGDDLRICMMTAAHDPESVRKAELYGADGFLTKPIHSQELLALVGRARLFPGDGSANAEGPAVRAAAIALGSPPTPPRGTAPAPMRSLPATTRKHVLVVDDDKDILEYCRAVFTKAGAVVDAIQNPDCLRDALPPGGSYDLVLLDIFMPSVDGIELLKRFSADVKNVSSRFYIITALEDAALRTLAHRSGADGYLTKPLEQKALLDLLAA